MQNALQNSISTNGCNHYEIDNQNIKCTIFYRKLFAEAEITTPTPTFKQTQPLHPTPKTGIKWDYQGPLY